MKRFRKLVEAVSSWLHFEMMCRREALFSERYMAAPIGQFLSARYGYNLRIELPHPVLASRKSGRGDLPRIDFAVVNDKRQVEIAVETKWVSTSTTLIRDIIRDMVRLELLYHHFDTQAYLLLAGKASRMAKLFGHPRFQGDSKHFSSRPILPYERFPSGSLRLNPAPKYRKELLSRAVEIFRGIELPNLIRVTKYGPVPQPGSTFGKRYIVCVWHIHDSSTGRFIPERIFTYDSKENEETSNS